DAISGTAQVGETLTAGTLGPPEATAVYQWQRSSTDGSDYENIAGAVESSYTLTEGDIDCYIRIAATGTGGYTGTVESNCVGPVVAQPAPIAIEVISETPQVESTPTTGAGIESGDVSIDPPAVIDTKSEDVSSDPPAGAPTGAEITTVENDPSTVTNSSDMER
ncbi:MAG TPA: hypothetical protein VM577_07675, partial [Anaerovoracaceae bacterium]|nr:hypothetical protein [Anaerovoracaceae bacterium]